MPTIEVQDLAKKYRINHEKFGNRAISQRIRGVIGNAMRNLRQGAALGHVEDFWALKHINFSVNDGEVVGVIGRNGAGKSTLLKILTRITQPTNGRAIIRGRVGSLLEVGTGFHSELTGRENVFLNASILGMKRWEIKARFDQIVDFSGVEKFLDTPVKRYSSGMKVRLAFAVAAHLDLEIMLVDEVLSVGDVDFQRKCLGKMDDVARTGRTILFVSHNLAALQNLCPRTLLLQGGRLVSDGDSEQVVNDYLKQFGTVAGSRVLTGEDIHRAGNGRARFDRVDILTLDYQSTSQVPMGDGMCVRMTVSAQQHLSSLSVAVHLFDAQGLHLCVINSGVVSNWLVELAAGEQKIIDCIIPHMNLLPGDYQVGLALYYPLTGEFEDRIEQPVSFSVTTRDVFHTGHIPHGTPIYFNADWQATTA